MGSLVGIRITFLRSNDMSRDSRVQKEATALADAGAEVTVVALGVESTWDPKHVRLQLVPPLQASTNRLWPLRVATNLIRERRQNQRVLAAALASRPDVVHAHDLDMLSLGVKVADRLRVPLVYEADEVLWDAAGVTQTSRAWRIRRWRSIEQRYIHAADRVLTVNPVLARWFQDEYHLRTTPVAVLGGPWQCYRSRKSVELPLRLLFQGYYSADRNLHYVVRSMKGLEDKVRLTLQGWGDEEFSLQELVRELGLQDVVTFSEPCEPTETMREASAHDVGVIAYEGSNLNLKMSSPNKLFDYVGGGLAVVASDLPFLREFVVGQGIGLVFDPEDEAGLRAALERLADDPAAVSQMKARSHEACGRCDWSTQAHVLVDVYSELAGARRGGGSSD